MRRFPLQWGIPLGVALLLIAIGVLTGSAANAQYPGPTTAAGSPQGNLGVPIAPAGAVGTPCTISTIITGSLTVSDTTEPDRLSRAGGISSCATPKTCPGPSFVMTPTLHYDTYTFSNTTGSPQCVTINVSAPTCDVGSSTYLTTFNPASLCSNYLADAGASTSFSSPITYSLTVAAGADFVVVVNEMTSGELCGTYTLTVGGCTGGVTPTNTPTNTPTDTAVVPTHTPTNTPTDTAVVPTNTPTNTPTDTAVVPTHTPTNTPTDTAVVPTHTPTNTPTDTAVVPTHTPTNTPTGTFIVPTSTPTNTPTDTPVVPTSTPTGTAGTAIPSNTAVASHTATPTATPVQVNCPLPFTDVDQFNPFYQYIQCLYCRGIISGYSDNTFRWTADVTRGQVSKIIANAAGLNDTVSGQTFTDVPPGNPFYTFIERLAGHGYINGYDTAANCPTGIPCFRWELPVTRGQLAKIDSNAAGYNETPGPTQQSFNDVPPANPFYVWIERLSLHGVINGYTCGGPGEPCPGFYYRPFANITRGQVSKVASQSFFPNACAPLPPPSATPTP